MRGSVRIVNAQKSPNHPQISRERELTLPTEPGDAGRGSEVRRDAMSAAGGPALPSGPPSHGFVFGDTAARKPATDASRISEGPEGLAWPAASHGGASTPGQSSSGPLLLFLLGSVGCNRGLPRPGPSARMDACFDMGEAFTPVCYVARAAGPVPISPCSAAFRAERSRHA